MEIYRRYGPALLRKCERMLGNRGDAEDVVQALFTDLLAKERTDVDLPYLYRAATRRCLNLLRDARRRRELLAHQPEAVPCPARSRLAERQLSADLLARLSDRLDRKSAEILVYRYVDDLTQEEIATVLSTSRKTVGKKLARIQRAVAALADEGREAAP